MVGSDGGAKLLRQTLLAISANTYTPLPHWMRMPLTELELWGEAMRKEESDE